MTMLKIGRVNPISSINFLAPSFLFLKTRKTPQLPHKHVQAVEATWGCEKVYISKQPTNIYFSQIFIIVKNFMNPDFHLKSNIYNS